MELSLASKVWIYQSNRVFTDTELERLHDILTGFTSSWTAHNQQLRASYQIRHQRFLILIVDETQAGASGCSIDKSVHIMKAIEQEFHVDLFDRFQIAWKEGDEIKLASRAEFDQLIAQKTVHEDTIVFNNLVKNLQELEAHWETPMKHSWHARVFSL